MGCAVACLPGLAMWRIADLYPGEAKTDARDACQDFHGTRPAASRWRAAVRLRRL